MGLSVAVGDTMKLDLPYLVDDPDRHGNPRIYFRRKGCRKVRLHAEPGSDEFLAEYQAAKALTPVPFKSKTPAIAPTSLRWLVINYIKSANFQTLGLSTQTARRGILEAICQSRTEKGLVRADLPFKRMRARHVRAIRDEKIGLPEAANGRVKALGQVFDWALKNDHVEVDPTVGVERLGGSATGWHKWTREEVRQYEDKHPIGSKARLALAILLYTGVRRSDAVKLGPQMERDGRLRFTETKGAKSRVIGRKNPPPKQRAIPILPELRAVIDATPSGHLAYLVTEFGKPFTASGFGNKMREWCDDAGLPQCSAHGCRKAGATIAAENGASIHGLMAIYGWKTLKQAEIYTREVDMMRLAGEQMHLVVDTGENEESPKVSHQKP